VTHPAPGPSDVKVRGSWQNFLNNLSLELFGANMDLLSEQNPRHRLVVLRHFRFRLVAVPVAAE
jgi:hypothetical protein